MNHRNNGARAYDLVAIDVDGTLLNSQGELSAGIESALQAVRERGITVSLVSGRGRQALMPLLRRLELDGPYVAAEGAYIADPSNGKVIACRTLAWRDAVKIVEMARAAQLSVFFESPEWWAGEINPRQREWLQSRTEKVEVTLVNDLLQHAPGELTKISLLGDSETLAQVEGQIRQCDWQLQIMYPSPTCLDICQSGVSKGTGLQRLASYLHIPLQRIAAIGDYYNDLSMLEIAGLAVAMGNSPPELKLAADAIAPTNDEGGVAWALHKLVLGTTI